MKKFLALTLAIAMTLCVCFAAGCGDTPAETTTGKVTETTTAKPAEDTTVGSGENPATETTAATEDTTEATVATEDTTEIIPVDPMETWDGYAKLPGFEDVDFRGTTFVLAGKTTDDVSFPTDIEIYTEETDPVSTAVRERNATVEKLYNCKIECISSENPAGLVSAEVSSGKHTIDIYTRNGDAGAATSGANYNLFTLGIDFSNSWWDQNYVSTYTVKNSAGTSVLYAAVGDFTITAFTATHAMMFNKNVYETKIAQGLGYDIYELVREGKWTMDIFVEMVKAAATDVSGNSEFAYDEGDILGWARTTHATHGLHAASGLPLIINQNGTFKFTANEQAAQWSDIMTKACEIWALHEAESLGYTNVREALTSGNTLFASEVLDVLRRMRDADVSAGLVPYPKYTEDQETYAHYVDGHVAPYSVPTSVVEIETVGKFLELYAAHSQKIVRSTWIDTYCYEYCGDADSTEMLDIILNTRTYDPGYLYWSSSCEAEVSNMISTNKAQNFSKWVGRKEANINGEIENFIAGIDDNKV